MDHEDNHKILPSSLERLRYIKKTVEERGEVGEDFDLGSLVANVMDAYSAQKIDLAASQGEFEVSTILLGRNVANAIFVPFSDFADLVAIVLPACVYALSLYPLLEWGTEWSTPLSSTAKVVVVSVPLGLALAFALVSRPKRDLRQNPIGVITETAARFVVRIPMRPAIIGLVLTGVISWFWLGAYNARREAKAVSFDYAKNLLVDKSLSAMEDLQVSPKAVLSNEPSNVTLGQYVVTIKIQESTRQDGVKFVIDDKGAFPGRLEADVSPNASVISWTEEGKPEVVKTQIYVCKVTGLDANSITLEALTHRDGSQRVLAPTQTESKTSASGGAVMILKVNGSSIDITFNPALISGTHLTPGQNVLLAFDDKSRVATRIELLSGSQTSQNSTKGLQDLEVIVMNAIRRH